MPLKLTIYINSIRDLLDYLECRICPHDNADDLLSLLCILHDRHDCPRFGEDWRDFLDALPADLTSLLGVQEAVNDVIDPRD